MSTVLFLSVPAHGNVNPTLGLVSELIKQGEKIVYFSSDIFQEKIEATGAIYKSYSIDLDIFKADNQSDNIQTEDPFLRVIRSADTVVADILEQTKDYEFDYIIHSAAFPFIKIIAAILNLPTVASLAIFSGLKDFFEEDETDDQGFFPQMEEMMQVYKSVYQTILQKYGVQLPHNPLHLMLNKADLSFIYTSDYFIDPSDRAFFDDTYKFVGPPVYNRKENLDFPFEKLQNKQVIYISLGTVFSKYDLNLYKVFFDSFGGTDAVVVLAAYQVDLSQFEIPANFIVRDYVPQSEILKYTDVAITHAGMNSISDLVYNHTPFVSIPLGADQPILAKRAEELGATIMLDAETLTADQLRQAVETVLHNPAYLQNIKKIDQSFREAGGYKRAVEEINKLKKEKDITD
jgi:MGT family glycosyltransferase